MALTSPPTAPAATDPTTFDSRSDAFVAWLSTHVTEVNVLNAALTAIAAGTAYSIPYTFSTTTTDSDPGSGTLRLSSATQNASTVIRADLLDAAGADWTTVLDTFDDSTSTILGQIKLTKLGDATKFLAFNVTALAAPSGYRNITVTNTGSSAASPFVNGDSVVLSFTRTGDKGATGSAAWAPLAVLTPTAAANVDFLSTFSATYDSYLIVGTGIKPAADDTLQFRVANAGTADTASNYYEAADDVAGTTAAATQNVGITTTSAGQGLCFSILIENANDATNLKTMFIKAMGQSAATPAYTSRDKNVAYKAAAAVSGGRLYWLGGSNFSATGKIRIYGLTNT